MVLYGDVKVWAAEAAQELDGLALLDVETMSRTELAAVITKAGAPVRWASYGPKASDKVRW